MYHDLFAIITSCSNNNTKAPTMDTYTVSNSTKVQEAEKDLAKEITELQNEIEDASMELEDSSKQLK